MKSNYLLKKVNILKGPNKKVFQDSVLILNDEIKLFGKEAEKKAGELKIKIIDAKNQLIAPLLVDPHSLLLDPINGYEDNLKMLKKSAAISGYGTVAILPHGLSFRDSPEKLLQKEVNQYEVKIYYWGGLTKNGEGKELSNHHLLINTGIIGFAGHDFMLPSEIIEKLLIIGETKDLPILLTPIERNIKGNGFVRESIEAYQEGLLIDNYLSEVIPLQQIIDLKKNYNNNSIRIKNISTKQSISILKDTISPPLTSVCWWNLVADSSNLNMNDLGWKVLPSIGSREDRFALIEGLKKKLIKAISVNSIALDEREILKPINDRLPGLSSYDLVLPALWQELIIEGSWSIEDLWQCLSFGPSQFLKTNPETINIDSKRWLLFDPNIQWENNPKEINQIKQLNRPWVNKRIKGKVIDTGLI
tara:strand:+ start:11317 stop:12570 length:1254 start_codon:yes stop_codon:yes gene_type:complete